MNKTQKLIVAIIIPIIIILLGFVLVDDNGIAYSYETGIAFDPIGYYRNNGIEWCIVVIIIGFFEYYWWKDKKSIKK